MPERTTKSTGGKADPSKCKFNDTCQRVALKYQNYMCPCAQNTWVDPWYNPEHLTNHMYYLRRMHGPMVYGQDE